MYPCLTKDNYLFASQNQGHLRVEDLYMNGLYFGKNVCLIRLLWLIKSWYDYINVQSSHFFNSLLLLLLKDDIYPVFFSTATKIRLDNIWI